MHLSNLFNQFSRAETEVRVTGREFVRALDEASADDVCELLNNVGSTELTNSPSVLQAVVGKLMILGIKPDGSNAPEGLSGKVEFLFQTDGGYRRAAVSYHMCGRD